MTAAFVPAVFAVATEVSVLGLAAVAATTTNQQSDMAGAHLAVTSHAACVSLLAPHSLTPTTLCLSPPTSPHSLCVHKKSYQALVLLSLPPQSLSSVWQQ